MNLSKYLSSWAQAQGEVRVHRIANVALVFIVFILTIGLMTKHTVVVMLPPQLSQQAWVSNDASSDEVLVQWGTSIALLLGNVTPDTAGSLKHTLGPMLTPRVYHEVLDAVDDQAKQITQEQVTVQFTPTLAKVDPHTHHVIVSGEQTTTGVQGTSHRDTRTYDLTLTVMNYRVLIDGVSVYTGSPKETH